MSKIISTISIILFNSLIIYLYLTNQIQQYIYKGYATLTFIAALLMIAVAILDAIFSSHQKINKAQSLILLLPCVLVAIYGVNSLSSQTAILRGINYDLPEQTLINQKFVFDTRSKTLLDWVISFNQNSEPEFYQNQTAQVEGFIVKDPNQPDDIFLITKYIMACCAADARPIAIPVKYDPTKLTPENDTWLQVTGNIIEYNDNGIRRPIIELTESKEIPKPKNAYDYI